MRITKLPPSRWQDYKQLYIEALSNSPEAFLWSLDEIDKKPDSEWQERIQNVFFAVSDDDKTVGMCGFYIDEKKKISHVANIVRVYVSTNYRKKGIGRRLLQTVIDAVKSKPEIKKLQLGVISTQEAAFNLYKSVGFKKVGEQKMAVKINDTFYNEHIMEMLFDK